MLSRLIAIIAPVAICVAIGFLLERRGRSLPRREVGFLVADVGAPALVFHALSTTEVAPSVLLDMALATSVAVLAFGVIGFAVARALGWPSHTFVPPVIFSNSGNMGLPLCLFAFGEQAMGLAVACFSMFTVWQFSVGLWIWSGKGGAGELLRSPIAWASVLGFSCAYLGLTPPEVVRNTTRLLGGLTIPLMLITLGVSLSTMRARHLGRALTISMLRLGLGPLVGYLVARAFELSGDARGVLIVQCAMPVAVFNYLLAVRYERAEEEVAGLIVLSTLLSLVTLPALLYLLL
jgi:hypothetical protein